MEDRMIVQLFFERSQQAIRELAAKYEKLLFRISFNILKNTEDVEECINDAYLGVWDKIPPEKPEPLRPYVCRIVRNLSLKRYRDSTRQKRNSQFDLSMEELEECVRDTTDVEKEISARELGRAIDCFLETLKKEERILFVRRYWFSDPIGNLAEELGISEDNISVKLYRIRKKLKEWLEREEMI